MPEIVAGTGTLYKRIFITEYIPGRPGTPASPGTPPTPGYWKTETSEVCVISLSDPVKTLSLLSAKVGSPVSVGSTFYKGVSLCTTVSTQVWVPPSGGTGPTGGVDAVPDQITYDYQLGWNARARSIPTMAKDGTFEATVTSNTVGAMVGLTAMTPDRGYADMSNAFYVRRGSVSIYEFGAEVQSVGSYPGAPLKLRRAAGKIQYFVNGTKVREIDASVMAPIWMSAGLYSGGDSLIEPSYTEEVTGRTEGKIQAFRGFITNTSFTTLGGTMQAFSGSILIPIQSGISGSLEPFTGYLGKDACIIGGVMAAIQGSVDGADLVPTYGLIGGQMIPAIGTLNMLTGQVMTVGASIQPFVGMVADRPTGYISGRVASFAGNVIGLPPGDAYIINDATSDGDIIAATELVAFINSVGTITGLMTVEVWRSALMQSQASIGVTMTTQAQIDVLLQSIARTISGLLPPDKTGEAWVFNQSAGGMTRYEGYDFNSFAEVGGHYYGAKSDGIYLLEGRDDDGTAVTSRVNFGSISFGTINRKALPYVYVGMASSGDTYLKVIADGQTFTYKVRDNTELMKAHRFEPGRGLRASFYDVELIADGEVFDLESIDFQPIELNRRL